jgi:hypothetical protein
MWRRAVALANNEHVDVFLVPGVPATRMLGLALFLLSSVIALSRQQSGTKGKIMLRLEVIGSLRQS